MKWFAILMLVKDTAMSGIIMLQQPVFIPLWLYYCYRVFGTTFNEEIQIKRKGKSIE